MSTARQETDHDERHRRYLLQRKEVLHLVAVNPWARQKSSDAVIEPSFRLPDGVLWNVLSFCRRSAHLFLPVSTYRPASRTRGHGRALLRDARPSRFSLRRACDGPRLGWEFTTRYRRTDITLRGLFTAPLAFAPLVLTRRKLDPLYVKHWRRALALDHRCPGYSPAPATGASGLDPNLNASGTTQFHARIPRARAGRAAARDLEASAAGSPSSTSSSSRVDPRLVRRENRRRRRASAALDDGAAGCLGFSAAAPGSSARRPGPCLT